MENKPKGNQAMFYTGIVFVIASAVLLLGNFMGDSTFPTILGVMGVIFIGVKIPSIKMKNEET